MRCVKLSKNFFYGFPFFAHRHIRVLCETASANNKMSTFQPVFFSPLFVCERESVYHFAPMDWLQKEIYLKKRVRLFQIIHVKKPVARKMLQPPFFLGAWRSVTRYWRYANMLDDSCTNPMAVNSASSVHKMIRLLSSVWNWNDIAFIKKWNKCKWMDAHYNFP